jgi:organic radical activating enzyme
MRINLENNQSFCIVPWVHSHISAQGERQLCCISDHNFGINVPLNEMWNSPEMKSIRKKMLNGEKLAICNRCNQNASSPHTYQNFFNDKFKHLINDVIDNTNDDGGYEKYPISIDYRTNICNFKCKMCWEGCSTQIQAEKIKNGITLNTLNNDQRLVSENIIKSEINKEGIFENIVDMYWAGGEPLYWKTHWETLEKLIETDKSKNVVLRYNTNLSVITHKNASIIDYFKHFNRVDFSCSLDGTSDIGEWVRTNLDYTSWRKNFSQIVNARNEYNNIKVYLAITMTSVTLFDLENLYQLCLEFNVSPGFQTCYVGESFSILTPLAFPKELIRSLINDFLDKHRDENNETINNFRNYLSFLIEKEFLDNDPEYLNKFKDATEQIVYLEKNRPHQKINFESILMINKPLYDFYMENKKNN